MVFRTWSKKSAGLLQRAIRAFYALAGFSIIIAALVLGIGQAILRYDAHTYATYWQNRTNQAGEFLLVVIGDSVAQGGGASRPEASYVSLLAASITTTAGRSVRVMNLAENGATARSALSRQIPKLAQYNADLTLLQIGSDEMKYYSFNASPIISNAAASTFADTAASATHSFAADYEQLMQALPPGKSIVADIPAFGGRKHAARQAKAANRTIQQIAAAYDLPVAPVYDTLKQHDSPWIYATDFFHPNDRGHRLWHDAIWQAAKPLAVSAALPPGRAEQSEPPQL